MPPSEEKNWIVPLFCIIFLVIVAGVLYYISTDYYKQRFPQGREEFDYGGRPVQSTATTDQVLLTKNEKLVIGHNCLVFRGVKKKMITVDLYLLELDPEQPYEKRFSKKAAKKEMLLGEGRYRLVSVNNQHLILKTIH